jgi:hypothetical protein
MSSYLERFEDYWTIRDPHMKNAIHLDGSRPIPYRFIKLRYFKTLDSVELDTTVFRAFFFYHDYKTYCGRVLSE